MRTVHEVSKQTGVSIRTLQYYDKIGLLHPAEYTESGYRLYDDTSLEKLQQILLFRELEFPLKEIQRIINSPSFDKNKALEQQITLLELKKEHLDNLISFARGLKLTGVDYMGDFEAFDTSKLDEYATADDVEAKCAIMFARKNIATNFSAGGHKDSTVLGASAIEDEVPDGYVKTKYGLVRTGR